MFGENFPVDKLPGNICFFCAVFILSVSPSPVEILHMRETLLISNDAGQMGILPYSSLAQPGQVLEVGDPD